MRSVILLTILAGLAACQSAKSDRRSSAEEIAWAHQQIDVQRITKRWLLIAEPLERQVEAALNADPRVASARFAIDLKGWESCGNSAHLLTFKTVVICRERMDDEAALQLLDAACASAGATPDGMRQVVAREETTWAIDGWFQPAPQVNPDLSAIATTTNATASRESDLRIVR